MRKSTKCNIFFKNLTNQQKDSETMLEGGISINENLNTLTILLWLKGNTLELIFNSKLKNINIPEILSIFAFTNREYNS